MSADDHRPVDGAPIIDGGPNGTTLPRLPRRSDLPRSEAKGAPPADPNAPRALVDKAARKAVQLGFLALFLYPFFPVIYSRVVGKPAPGLTSWLLPWDPLLFAGHLVHRDWSVVVLGAPLLLLSLTLVLGRFFCGWVCPVGTVLDLERATANGIARLAGRRRPRKTRGRDLPLFPARANSPARYLILAAVLAGGALSLQALGVLDPLVIFQRTATVITSDFFALQKPLLRVYVAASAVFLTIVVLELWQPRFWCRHLCPLGALLSLPSRWSLLNRRVGATCNGCGDCRRVCPMQAISKEGHDTHYGDCHLCLNCEAACPRGAITFGFGALAGRKWHTDGRTTGRDGKPQINGRYLPDPEGRHGLALTRRSFLGAAAASAAGLALPLGLRAAPPPTPVIRPPGALPEADFLRTCILCQECIRICPPSALRPATWQAGAAGIGTPVLAARQGGCQLLTSCPNLCAQVCPVGAIRPIARSEMKIALAYVDRSACLAWDQGRKCLVCVEACPTGAAQPFNGRVTVDPQKCTGCGKCEQVCPVADSAIHVRPLA